MSALDLSTSFTGRYFVVTGSTQGLGAAVARTLAQRGAAGLIICGRSRDKGEQQVRQLAELDCQAFFVEADMENVDDCRRVVAAAKEHFGTVILGPEDLRNEPGNVHFPGTDSLGSK